MTQGKKKPINCKPFSKAIQCDTFKQLEKRNFLVTFAISVLRPKIKDTH